MPILSMSVGIEFDEVLARTSIAISPIVRHSFGVRKSAFGILRIFFFQV